MIDLLIASAFLQQAGAFQLTDLASCSFFSQGDSLVLTGPEPKEVPCVANGAWKGNQMIAIAGGGVSIDAASLLREAKRSEGDVPEFQLPQAIEKWWWD